MVNTQLITFGAMFVVIGMLAAPLLMLIIGPLIPAKYSSLPMRILMWMAMRVGGAVILLFGEDGYRPYSTARDHDSGGWAIWRDGEKRTFENAGGRMHTLAKQPFGIAVGDLQAILDPADAVVNEYDDKKIADGGDHKIRVDLPAQLLPDHIDQPVKSVPVPVPITKVPDGWILADIRRAVSGIAHSASPELAERAEKQAIASQSRFGRNQALLAGGMVLVSVGVGFLMGHMVASGSGGSAIALPFTVSVPPTLPLWLFGVG